MTLTMHLLRAPRMMGSYLELETSMKWETPQAIELRFGMEITMYVANR